MSHINNISDKTKRFILTSMVAVSAQSDLHERRVSVLLSVSELIISMHTDFEYSYTSWFLEKGSQAKTV